MPDLVYRTVDGLDVTLEAWNREHHIQHRHPEVTLQDIVQTLTVPQRIREHRAKSSQRVYQGFARTTGFFRGSFPMVVVECNEYTSGQNCYRIPDYPALHRKTAMTLNTPRALTTDYDAQGDVLYVSLAAPQPALSLEVEPDVLLRYVPPSLEVVGITFLNFLRHFPGLDPEAALAHVTAVAEAVLRKYPKVPL
jgi:hypothetical protein